MEAEPTGSVSVFPKTILGKIETQLNRRWKYHVANHSDYYSCPGITGKFAGVAVQHGLGLLSQRRIGATPADYLNFRPHG
jgi:hypothetical protein